MTVEPRYSHPKVMLIDLPDAAVQQVVEAGFRVQKATLGRPQKLPVGVSVPNYLPATLNGRLPGFAEQEVVVIQQRAPEASDLRPEDVAKQTKDTRVWADTDEGVIDTRPMAAHYFSDDAQRILDHGGIFIVFCEPRTETGLVLGDAEGGYGFFVEGATRWTVWDLVPELNSFSVEIDHGEEIRPTSIDALDSLAPYLSGATFDCTLEPGYKAERWVPLARNKYGKDVAGLLVTEENELTDGSKARGWVFLLPQVKDPGACVTTLLNEVLPDLAPRLFPETERTAWLHNDMYELPSVLKLKDDIVAVRAEAERRETELKAAIEKQREEEGWLHTLITGTGDELVDAVKSTLDDLGLQDVRKVDDEAEEERAGRRREDLQVWGKSPIVLVEVKGITGLPKEQNSLQVTKYLNPRMREWDRTDVRGLSVINQQRALPPLERENVHTFQDDVLVNAEEQKFGLVTTIDLFRLARNKRAWGWEDESVAPIFYQDGRIRPIPLHYNRVGVVDGFFAKPGVVTLTVTDRGFAVGNELAFILPIDYEQHVVESIQLDGVDVTAVEPGQRVGIKTTLTKAQARNGVEVYRVQRPG